MLVVGALRDLIGESTKRDLERDDIAVKVRLGHREEQLLRIYDCALRVFAREREMRDLVRRSDETAQESCALDDRRVRLGVGDRRHVLHEADEELRATDVVELAARRELGLYRLESERLAALPHALDRAEDEPMRLARELGRCDAAAHRLLIDARVDEDSADEACLGLGLLRGRFGTSAHEIERHTGMSVSGALLKNRACSDANSSENGPVGPLRFFATLPWMRRGAPGGVSSLSLQSMRTMSESCSRPPLSRRVESFGSRPESPAARESCERPMTTTLSSRASDLRLRVIVEISCTRFSSSSPVRMSWM